MISEIKKVLQKEEKEEKQAKCDGCCNLAVRLLQDQPKLPRGAGSQGVTITMTSH